MIDDIKDSLAIAAFVGLLWCGSLLGIGAGLWIVDKVFFR
jgi:hypothetical protein